MENNCEIEPTITVRIVASSSTFDLSDSTGFTFNLTFTLEYKCAITFDKRFAGLFNGNVLYQDGLTFADTTTSSLVPRNQRNLCYMSSNCDGTPCDECKDGFFTLIPGQEHTIQIAFKPIPGKTKWWNVEGFEDGHTYKIGISDEAVVKNWLQGSLSELLEMKAQNRKPEIKRDSVKFVLAETTTFRVSRPDEDGSLNWDPWKWLIHEYKGCALSLECKPNRVSTEDNAIEGITI